MTPVITASAVRLGVDLGGTGTRIVALTEGREVAGETIVETRSLGEGNGTSPIDSLVRLLDTVAGDAGIGGVGIGASGPIDAEGVVRNHDTLPLFSDIPLVATIAQRLGVPCAIDSDAVTFTLGEYRLGAGQGARTLCGVTLGTGIGACILREGQPERDGDGLHPEFGHIPVPGGPAPCYCGLESCWEQLASRTALEELALEAGIADLAAGAAAARDGDPRARAIFDRYGRLVGSGLATLCTIFRPDRVVIGGGAAPFLDLFLVGIRAALQRKNPYETEPEIRAAGLGAVAGAVGAATLTDPRASGT